MALGGSELPSTESVHTEGIWRGASCIQCLPHVLLEGRYSTFQCLYTVPGMYIAGTQCLLNELMIEKQRAAGCVK